MDHIVHQQTFCVQRSNVQLFHQEVDDAEFLSLYLLVGKFSIPMQGITSWVLYGHFIAVRSLFLFFTFLTLSLLFLLLLPGWFLLYNCYWTRCEAEKVSVWKCFHLRPGSGGCLRREITWRTIFVHVNLHVRRDEHSAQVDHIIGCFVSHVLYVVSRQGISLSSFASWNI